MVYHPEKLTIESCPDNIAEIVSQSGEKIAKINLNHPVWQFGSEHASDEEYMRSIELLGDTKKLEGISASYKIGGVVVPVFKSRETKDGAKIFYDTDGNLDPSVPFCEKKRECGDKTYLPRFHSYEHMEGLTITDDAGYDILDQKTGLTKVYDEHENLIAEQIDQNKIKITSAAATKYTDLNGAAYAVVEQYGKPSRLSHGCISIHQMKPKTATVYDNTNKEMAQFRFYENGHLEECYQLDKQGKRKNYHHYNGLGRENTLWFLLGKKLSKSQSV